MKWLNGNRQLRVCMVAYTHFSTDPRVKREAEALAETCEVDMISLQEEYRGDAGRNGLTFHHLEIRRFRAAKKLGYLASYFVFFLKVFRLINRLDRRRRFDILYFHTMPDFIVFAGIVQKLKGRRIILDIHDLFPELYVLKFNKTTNSMLYRVLVRLERMCAGFADTVVSVHHPHQRRLASRGISDSTVIMNVPDTVIFNPARRRPPRRFRFVFHGTISKRLGMDLLVEVGRRLRADPVPGVYFDVIGVGEYADEFKRLISGYGLEELIRFDNRFYPIESLPERIGDAFAGIVPYEDNIAHIHALSVKMLEYVAMKIPVVTVDIPSNRYYFDDDACAYFRSHDTGGVIACIREMTADSAAAEAMAEHAYTSFCGTYAWEREKLKLQRLVAGEDA